MPDLVLPRRVESTAQACTWVEATMERSGWPAADVTRVVLAVGECVSNPVEHGTTDGPLRLTHEVSEHQTSVRVHDGGAGPPGGQLEGASLPDDPLATGGRGLYIQRQLADRVAIDADGGVRLTFVRSR